MVVPAGGKGRRRRPEDSVFLKPWWFLGIPGVCSQEKGIPINFRGVIGLCRGDGSLKENSGDSKNESQESDRDDDENDGVRRVDGRNFGVE